MYANMKSLQLGYQKKEPDLWQHFCPAFELI